MAAKKPKFTVTKLSGNGGLIDLKRSEKYDLQTWLFDILNSTERRRRKATIKKLNDLLETEVFESINAGLEEEVKAIEGLCAMKAYTTDNDCIFEVDLIFNDSNLPRAKEAFKKLLRTKSNLDGIRGKRDRNEMRYTLAVDVSGGFGEPSDGIHRLIRLIYGIRKYHSGEDL